VTYAGSAGYRNKISVMSQRLRAAIRIVWKRASRWRWTSSYLTLDIYFVKRGSTKVLEKCSGVANLHAEMCDIVLVAFLFDYVLCAMRLEELTTCFIVFEAKLVSEETKGNISISDLH
jgi:hypothetical protein